MGAFVLGFSVSSIVGCSTSKMFGAEEAKLFDDALRVECVPLVAQCVQWGRVGAIAGYACVAWNWRETSRCVSNPVEARAESPAERVEEDEETEDAGTDEVSASSARRDAAERPW